MKKATILLNTLVLLIGTAGADVSFAGDWSASAKSLVPLAPPLLEESGLSYDFVDLQYLNTDFGSEYFSSRAGFGAGFSKLITEDLFVNGSYSFNELDYMACRIGDTTQNHKYRLGAGVRKSLAKSVDLTFEGGAEFLDAYNEKNPNRNFDSWGYYVGPGIRARAGRFETFANVYYFHREGDNSQSFIRPPFRSNGYSEDPYGWRFTAGFIYHLTENFGIKVAGEIEDYDNTLLVGARYQF